MRRLMVLGMMLLCSAMVAFGTEPSTAIKGDYLEARTASVFAGACHYNGEVVTTGRDAVVAWSIKSGKWNGVDLAGVRAMAVVASGENLIEEKGERRAEIVIDNSASEAQAKAFVGVLQTKHAASIGKIDSVRRAPVTFRHDKTSYFAEVSGFATLSVDAMPNDECCKMPHMVWYKPLVPVENRKVGYTAKAAYAGGKLGDAWERGRENSAFYGSFTL